MAIEWKDSYTVNNEMIDSQHKELIKRIGDFHSSIMEKRGKTQIRSTLKFVEDYTIYHFTAEEELMEKYNYPDIAAHKAKHTAFIDTVAKLKDDFEKKGATDDFILSVQRFLLDWIILHITTVDIKYGKFLADKE